ncbi:Uma2 family endonuclease [Synechococcales cyanobacterium C]|uniref:Uma2 family endonuclease n=1 Tax=Petrachloros mirabilis ULC683 TaxID=2781853 RepID=A0A8K2A0V9_9CYAN|nr:Uma2 family endonuclease [Petrachloros mirabilis]NCJ08759.1 Uma2 family endonuclease [Petrachloros mirabilis ULC683]
MTALTLNVDAIARLTLDQFHELCRANRDIRLELTAKGELVLMPPTGWQSGKWNATLTTALSLWNSQVGLGVVFDSSTGFILPNGSVRSPDVAWVTSERIKALNPDPEGFLPLALDFVIELRSASDHLKSLQNKMQEYIDNGVRLGYLLNPQDQTVEIYRMGQPVEILQWPAEVLAEAVLPGFVLNLKDVFAQHLNNRW